MWTSTRLLVASLPVLLLLGPALGDPSSPPSPTRKPPGARPRTTAPRPSAAALNSISIAPGSISLQGRRTRQAVLVTGKYADGSLRDLTERAKLVVGPAKVAALVEGAVLPRGDGK